MATYHVWSGGSNTSPYETWAKAATALATAFTEADTLNDLILIHKAHDETLGADVTYTANAAHLVENPLRVIVVDKDDSDTPVDDHTDMGANGIDGDGAYHIKLAGNLYVWGLRIINGDSDARTFTGHLIFENCEIGINAAGAEYFGFEAAGKYIFLNCLILTG